MSRPHKPKTLDARVTVRFSVEDLYKAHEQADAAALPFSEFVRRCTLAKKIVSKADLRTLAELRRLGGLLKHIHVETNGTYAEDTRKAIQALEAYGKILQTDILKGTRTRNEADSPAEETES